MLRRDWPPPTETRTSKTSTKDTALRHHREVLAVFSEPTSFLSSLAALLCGDHEQADYGQVILLLYVAEAGQRARYPWVRVLYILPPFICSGMSIHMKKIEVAGRIVQVAEYGDLDRAKAAAARSHEWVVMGDCDDDGGVFWTCRPVDAEQLIAAGYELAR